MRTRPFRQPDVFTDTPTRGNPVAVVLDGQDLDGEAMQRFARWTNLSETTFVLPPTAEGAAGGADYRVRIFTPGGELPFAGHPTLGTCSAWLAHGGQPRRAGGIVQECAIGLVPIRAEGERLAFAAPPLQRSAPSPMLLSKVAAALGLKASQIEAAQCLDNGPVWLGLLLDSPDTVLALRPDHAALKALGQKVGVAARTDAQDAGAPPLIGRANREARAFGARGSAAAAAARAAPTVDLEVRAFAAPIGVEEDPVTGSLNASLAQWLIADGLMPARYVAGQGQCLGRDGRVHVAQDASGQIWIGGDVADCIEGRVRV
ncbi:PhzF family phenazine biosynthesis protein [Pseudacidovorax intermedius]|uniref:PhzF family phenazine biosynthesis protein n=1 Tax=Pseudacidovorax intermedius TaxID=433924 RepID=A0A370FPS8_9BURK|nr:PhzF family phenazine biosynthesis protein [Pseudacidovorax intermedius]RDI29570.1 PhzF family phenazine biosynthesis protein [Pseudacidovorax intermedius]